MIAAAPSPPARPQGSSWDRVRRRFYIHDDKPRPLVARVSPQDVDCFRPAPKDATSGSGDSDGPAPRFALYSYTTGAVEVLGAAESMQVKLEAGRSDVVTVAPVTTLPGGANGAGALRVGVECMPLGDAVLPDMQCFDGMTIFGLL